MHLWEPRPGTPYLYTLHATCGADVYDQTFGVRSIEVRGTQVLLNGKPLYFKGFCKHEDFTAHGRGFDPVLNVKDVNLIHWANANAVRNHLEDTVHFRCANVLDELPKLAEAGEKYDVVILDPPAFTKSREATKNAIKGYREINMKGLKLVKDGGYLATCSCSHFMTQELLAKTVKEAAKAAHKRLRQVEFRTQAPDHPILWANSANVPESYYLKFFIFQVVDEK